MKQFLAGVLIGWLVLGLTVHAKDSASEKIVQAQVLVANQKVKTHSSENVGAEPYEMVSIELKQ